MIIEEPQMGDIVFWHDEDKQPHAAIVAHVGARSKKCDRPILNLTIFYRAGRVAYRMEVGPAYHNGKTWVLINRWSIRGEVPEDEWNYLNPPSFRSRGASSVGRVATLE